MLGVLLIIVGIQFFSLGFLAEMLTNLLIRRQTDYSIRSRLG
jgi:hypothetical protein